MSSWIGTNTTGNKLMFYAIVHRQGYYIVICRSVLIFLGQPYRGECLILPARPEKRIFIETLRCRAHWGVWPWYDTLLKIWSLKRKLRWFPFGYVVRTKGTLANTILQDKVEEKTSRGRPARQWLNDVKEWTGQSLNEMWKEPEEACQSCYPKRTV